MLLILCCMDRLVGLPMLCIGNTLPIGTLAWNPLYILVFLPNYGLKIAMSRHVAIYSFLVKAIKSTCTILAVLGTIFMANMVPIAN